MLPEVEDLGLDGVFGLEDYITGYKRKHDNQALIEAKYCPRVAAASRTDKKHTETRVT